MLASIGSPAEIAGKCQISRRAVENYRQGRVPCRRIRQRFEAEYGIPESAWQQAPASYDPALVQCVNALTRELARLLRERSEDLSAPKVAS